MGIGSATVNLLLKILTRRQVIILSIIGMIISNLIISLVHNVIVFAIFRFIGSIFLGFNNVLILNILAEYLPVKFRGFVLNIVCVTASLGIIYFLLFCKIYDPQLSYNPLDKNSQQDFNSAIFSIFYIEIINLFLVYFFLKDSPRNLLMNDKIDEAKEILNYYVGRELTQEEIDSVYYNVKNTGENQFGKKHSDFKLLFSRRYVKLSILMIIIYFFYSFTIYGMHVSNPFILKKRIKMKKI